jgi:hypothetical protein
MSIDLDVQNWLHLHRTHSLWIAELQRDYSYLSAINGSTRDAVLAGRNPARIALTTMAVIAGWDVAAFDTTTRKFTDN